MPKNIRKTYKTPIGIHPAFSGTPDSPEDIYQLGWKALHSNNYDLAANYFYRALQADPKQPYYWWAFGSISQIQGKIDEAIRCFCKALELNPDFPQAWNKLGSAYQYQANLIEAEKCYQKSIGFQPDNFDALLGLGHILIAKGKMEEAEQALRRAILLNPHHTRALNSLAYSLKGQNKHTEAASVYRHAWLSDPNDLKACIGAHLILPMIPSSTAELLASRTRYAEGLKNLHGHTEKFLKVESKKLLSGLNWTNFYLAYQGKDDKPLQMEYARFVADILHGAVPDLMQPIQKKPVPRQRRIRIGFLSSFLRNCTVGSYFKSWITALDKNTFENYCYFYGNIQDQVTEEFIHASDNHRHLVGGVEHIGRQVKQDQLDILVYPEIGMDPVTYTLAAMRLAPIQCAAWGHPVTTGHANIDYFFSSILMEPENGPAHYSEKLVLLEGIGTCYSKPTLPSPTKRSSFSLPEERILFLCPQSLYKIHPDNDRLLFEILARNQNATLVFFQATDLSITQAFIRRLERLLYKSGMERASQIKMLPRMDRANYLRVNMLCDVMLDTLHWSGGNTTLDALACGLPVVTLPGEFMRGRQSYGMLKSMDLHELIAQNPQNYIEIATRLGMDRTWHRQITQRILKNSSLIFSNETPLRQIEEFLTAQLNADSPLSPNDDMSGHPDLPIRPHAT